MVVVMMEELSYLGLKRRPGPDCMGSGVQRTAPPKISTVSPGSGGLGLGWAAS